MAEEAPAEKPKRRSRAKKAEPTVAEDAPPAIPLDADGAAPIDEAAGPQGGPEERRWRAAPYRLVAAHVRRLTDRVRVWLAAAPSPAVQPRRALGYAQDRAEGMTK